MRVQVGAPAGHLVVQPVSTVQSRWAIRVTLLVASSSVADHVYLRVVFGAYVHVPLAAVSLYRSSYV